jgi:hypothetical protein
MPTTKDVMNHAPTTGVADLATAAEVVLAVAPAVAVVRAVRAAVARARVAAFVPVDREAPAAEVISVVLPGVHGLAVQAAPAVLQEAARRVVSLGTPLAVVRRTGAVPAGMLPRNRWCLSSWRCVPIRQALYRWRVKSS